MWAFRLISRLIFQSASSVFPDSPCSFPPLPTTTGHKTSLVSSLCLLRQVSTLYFILWATEFLLSPSGTSADAVYYRRRTPSCDFLPSRFGPFVRFRASAYLDFALPHLAFLPLSLFEPRNTFYNLLDAGIIRLQLASLCCFSISINSAAHSAAGCMGASSPCPDVTHSSRLHYARFRLRFFRLTFPIASGFG